MQTPKPFEQITGGIASPETMRQWLSALLPSGANGKELFTRPSAVCLASIQSLLKGSDVLRPMQLDAIHNTQKRAAQLARSLTQAAGPLDAGKAWQQFSQDNLQNTIEYWTACREIVQDIDLKMLNEAKSSIGKTAKDEAPQARLVTPVKRNKATKSHTRSRTAASR